MKYVLVITMHADPAMAPGYEEWGGTHTYMKELMDGFGARKINCIMVTRKSMPLQDIEQYNEYCTIYRLHNGDVRPMDKGRLQYYHEDNLGKIQLIIDKYGKPEVIHSVYWNSGRLAMELAQRNGIPFVHSVISNARGRISRGATEPIANRPDYEQQVYNKAACILCVSEDERQDIIDFYGIDPGKVCVVGQFIHESFLLPAHDTNGFPRLNSTIDEPTQEKIALEFNSAYTMNTKELYWSQKIFTFVGRISFYKGIDYIMIAWYRLYLVYDDQCPALWIVGGSINEISQVREEVKKQIQNLDLLEKKGKLIWWGYLDAAGISTILLKSLVLITHSRYEPGGRVVVEAMLEGVPVIATPNGFAKDYIQDWHNGFLVKYADIDDLFLCLEYFVRQPFLSNALGQSARQDAKRIVKQWNFLDNHLMAYGFGPCEEMPINEDTSYDYFKKRNIHLFPYYNVPLSEKYIKRLFEKISKQSVVEFQTGVDSEYTSHVFRVKGSHDTLIFKQTFTRLCISPLFNPFSSKDYVRRADKHFHIELTAYQRSGSTILAGYETEHQLLVLKELTPPHNVDLNFLRQCIQYIITKKDTATTTELDIFHQIIQTDMGNYNSIQGIYSRLEQELPCYYFEVSGVFCEKLGWAVAPYILEYNYQSITLKLKQRFIQICDYFTNKSSQNTRQELRCINIDTELRHFMFNGNNIEMLDYEKCAIGCVENEVASLLYDYLVWKKQGVGIDPIKNILKFVPSNLNIQKIIISMAYRCFYDIMIRLVMRCYYQNTEIEWLEYLYSAFQNSIQQ